MNKKYVGIGCLGIFVLFIIIMFFVVKGMYNGMVSTQETAKEAWSNIDVILKRNQQNLNSLENILKSATQYNKETLEEVVNARARATAITIDPTNCTPQQMEQWSQAQDALSQALGRLIVANERYPELQANEHYHTAIVELEGAVNRLSEARRKYNETVKVYNTKVRSFPNNLFAGMFGFEVMYPYEAPLGTEENTTDFSDLVHD